MPSGLNALAQMGLSSLLAQVPHRPLEAWEFWVEGRSLFQVNEPMASGEQACTLVSQPALLEALIDKANAYPNFEFLSGRPVQTLQRGHDRVSGVVLGNGHTRTADLVIGADGRTSVVRQQAGLTLAQQMHALDVLWFKLADSPYLPAENVFYSIVQGRHAFGLFRSSEGHVQLGWALHKNDSRDWKTVNWPAKLAAAAPTWLAAHLRSCTETIERPVLLSVTVGRAPRWYVPGVLLLGDAAHPMSPIRAQGINMALRDAIVATNYLVPAWRGADHAATIDAVLPQIQAERDPEIMRIQQLQQAEVAQGERLRNNTLMRQAVRWLAPWLRGGVRRSWLQRQHQLRQGVTEVILQEQPIELI